MYLAFLEFLGTTELLVILFAALILFGPRRLPQLSRQLGRSLSDFKRASEDFKRTWEKEVELEKLEEEGRIARAMLTDDPFESPSDERRGLPLEQNAEAQGEEGASSLAEQTPEPTIARTDAVVGETQDTPAEAVGEGTPSRKRDWL